ncbi:hypothetical protein NJI34_28580 [Pseudomonas sp. S 311-6]|uniref:hypothetical protein n=1 Tax=Pseudomonas TaxID=286 RepID=UPI00209765E8|nr:MULTISPECIES: hypothetical protein [Pseudomonas]MCO7566426.1 hypothetical protein [Pseudomonas mosselii]MCO7617454.1 hypothetical protein [Pseudomonas guariconensis]MCO7640732.1 hypothetical protein [Pseudomonas sp. S 311-6]
MTIDKEEIKALALACAPFKCADEAEEDRRLAEFHGELTPEAVLSLLAEIDQLKAGRKACWEEFKVQGRQLDQLKAENEALRSAVMDVREFIMHEAEVRGLLDGSGQVSHHHPRRQAAIASIDAAMAKEGSHG